MPTSPLRVLFLMEDLCYGGTQRQTLELARRLDRQKFTPVMLTLTGPTDLDAAARDAGIELHHLGTGRRVPPTFFLRLAAQLNRLDPDIIMPCTALPNIWGRIWPRVQRFCGKGSNGPRVVGTCRGGGAPTRQHEKFFWRLTDYMICNSEVLQSILLGFGVPREQLSYIPNGVDTDFFAPSEPAPSLR
ncbi:MAG: glycosyltransferase family 4 protein, partial [Desulfovibrio sp.]|nr:glycosyltransferase family 4 protein [Desulfovibrio sp.]